MSDTELGKQQLWASRFKKGTNPIGKQYSESVTVDRNMFYQDIWGSEAHSIMLGYTGIIKEDHSRKILEALQKIKKDFSEGTWDLGMAEEDVHMNVERFVIDTVGIENGGRMHTCRSRNDQVVLDTKLYSRDKLLEVKKSLSKVIKALLDRSKEDTTAIMPGYTHTQHAQPMTVAYWFTHYAAIFLRDLERLSASYKVTDTNPLGAGALTGTSFPIDRKLTTRLLGFEKVQEHCLDAVTARDYNLQTISSLAILFSTLSRIAEEVIYGITHEFRTMVLDDSLAMGSSMMPQKKNPGVLELVRGRTGKMYGILMAMLTTIKGLPSGYNRDYHEDKTTLVEALALANETLQVIQCVIETIKINKDRTKELVNQNFAAATELANYLVRDHNIPFRLCHRIVGYVVGELVEEGKNFTDYKRTQELLADKDIVINEADLDRVLNPEQVIEKYNSLGGTSPVEVERMIEAMYSELSDQSHHIADIDNRIDTARNETAEIVRLVLDGGSLKEAVNSVLRKKEELASV
ncbi:MAG: argininosuccinate lyase [Chlamydiales bacterium]|jgi:argininosuccinate lyase